MAHLTHLIEQKRKVRRLPLKNLVPKAGLEPARGITTRDFESRASAYSATSATPRVVYHGVLASSSPGQSMV